MILEKKVGTHCGDIGKQELVPCWGPQQWCSLLAGSSREWKNALCAQKLSRFTLLLLRDSVQPRLRRCRGTSSCSTERWRRRSCHEDIHVCLLLFGVACFERLLTSAQVTCSFLSRERLYRHLPPVTRRQNAQKALHKLEGKRSSCRLKCSRRGTRRLTLCAILAPQRGDS